MTSEIMSFFERNPFSTPVGQRIEQATDASLASENWALNMEICDLINDTEDGPKDGIKAIRKRLQQNAGKNYTVVMYTLTVLETCVKNCGRRFHLLSCCKDFVQELVKLIGPKNDPPTVVQDKVLSLIQSWADAFRHQTELSGVVQVYNELRQKGIEFPMTDLDAMAPIITPQRSVTDGPLVSSPAAALRTVAAPSPPPVAVAAAAAVPTAVTSPPTTEQQVPVGQIQHNLTAEQLGKLRSELDVVQTNMSVLSAMLSEITPGKEHPSDRTLLEELHSTCQAMQKRLVELIGKISHDQLTAELLRINDEMNNMFLRFARYEKNRDASVNAASKNSPAAGADALIDLSDNTTTETSDIDKKLSSLALAGSATAQLSKIASVPAQHGAEGADSEFDMFAQARNVTYESSKKSGSTYKDNLNPDQSNTTLGEMAQVKGFRDSDFDEIEAWLEEETGDAKEAVESLTSSEFERFLAERAAAAENLPTVTTASGGATPRQNNTTTTATSTSGRSRELDKDDTENTLFAL